MKCLVVLFVLITLTLSYEFKCDQFEEYKYQETPGKGYDEALNAVEITKVHRCPSQHGKIMVRNLKGEISEITINEHYYPVSSTSSYTEIPVLDGHYKVRAIKRTQNHCKFREFNETILFTDVCEPYYVYVIKKGDMVFQIDDDSNTTSTNTTATN